MLVAALFAAGPPDALPIENFREVGSDLCVGGEPAGDAAFRALAARGVKTVVSVDGAKPDVATARKHGLRYVHIPLGYDGVSEQAGLALARVVCDCDGPVFVHCHHGKHRGPAAAAVMGIVSGRLDRKAATHLLEQAGTSRDYAGLWRDVAAYEPPAADATLPELVETAEVDSLAAAMVDIDRIFERLKAIEAAGWKAPADEPDLVPHREATLLREAFRESTRLLSADREDLRPDLETAESLAADLEQTLRATDDKSATAALAAVQQNCADCHRAHRDGG